MITPQKPSGKPGQAPVGWFVVVDPAEGGSPGTCTVAATVGEGPVAFGLGWVVAAAERSEVREVSAPAVVPGGRMVDLGLVGGAGAAGVSAGPVA